MTLTISVLIAVMDVTVIAPGAGVVVSPPIEISPKGEGVSGVAVAADRNGFVVTWVRYDPKTNKSCAYLQRLGKDGKRVGTSAELTCAAIGAPQIRSGGTTPLVMWGEKDVVVGMTVSPNGPKPAFRIATPEQYIALTAVGWDGKRYWIAWSDHTELHLQQASAAGALIGTAERMSTRWGPKQQQQQITQIALPCTATGCTLAYGNFVVNSQVDQYAWPLERGKIGEWTKLGAGRYASAPQIWQIELPTFASHPFFGANQYGSVRAIGAESRAGSLVAWKTDEMNNNVRFAWVPADPAHARHDPIELPQEADPRVVAIDATHFLLVTSGAPARARYIAIDPAYFAKLPTTRPAVATGMIVASDGKPAAGARVQFRLVYKDGGQLSSSGVIAAKDGSFTIPHPDAKNHQAEKDVVGIEVWAEREGETSPIQAGASGARMTFKLGATAKLDGTITNAPGVEVTIDISIYAPTSTLRSSTITWQKHLTARDKFDVGDLPSGKVEIVARASDGRKAWTTLTLPPGKRTSVPLALARTGTLVLSIVDANGPTDAVPVVEGVDISAVLQTHQQQAPFEIRDLAAGSHRIEIVHEQWQMTRRHTVRPRSHTDIVVQFECDLRPGQVGIMLAADARGIVAQDVAPGSPAERAGVQPGELLIAIGGTTPTDPAHARQLLQGAGGSKVELKVGTRTITLVRSLGTGAFAAGGIPELTAAAAVAKP